MAKVKTNSTQKFIDKCITLETTVFDPRIEQHVTTDELENLEQQFERWVESTTSIYFCDFKPQNSKCLLYLGLIGLQCSKKAFMLNLQHLWQQDG